MNVGAFGENFPYSNFHDLNMDWIIKVAKDFLDQYTHLQETIEEGEQSLQDKADELEALLQAWYDTHSEDIAQQLADAISSLNTWYTTHQNYLDQTLADNIASFNQRADQKATETLASIPSDYTSLANTVETVRMTSGAFENNMTTYLATGKWVRGVYNPATQALTTSFTYRISTMEPISFPFFATLKIAPGFRFHPYLYTNGAWTAGGWKTGEWKVEAGVQFYGQIARATEDTSETANINEFLSQVTVKGSVFDVTSEDYYLIKESLTFKYLNFELGGYYTSGTQLVKQNPTNDRIRSRDATITPQCLRVRLNKSGARIGVMGIDENGDYQGTVSINTLGETRVVFESRPTWKAIVVVIVDNSLTAMPENLDTYAEIYFENDAHVKNGKNLYIYKFGGKGNDWCWVRTPEGFNQMRDQPYPFVICNHGNNWIMDGTEQTANYTKRTMYVPLTDPDYQADPTEYNGTDDSSLWYSNPTIEALLSAGYVVCGCENYGDELYGNNDCRNACVDFFYHMTRRYNVEDRCFMIGVSNGALTALNASYLLQGKVRALILQYPITCLVNQYEANSSHQAKIRQAYGITNANITPEQLAKAVETHDPLTTDVVNGIKVGVIPPTKFYYSPDDIVANYQVNSIALYTLLDNSNKVAQGRQCSGEHGDHTHFQPTEVVAWFNAN